MGMKRRYLAVLMGIMVTTTSVPAMVYAEDSKTEAAADAADTTNESVEADAVITKQAGGMQPGGNSQD